MISLCILRNFHLFRSQEYFRHKRTFRIKEEFKRVFQDTKKKIKDFFIRRIAYSISRGLQMRRIIFLMNNVLIKITWICHYIFPVILFEDIYILNIYIYIHLRIYQKHVKIAALQRSCVSMRIKCISLGDCNLLASERFVWFKSRIQPLF